MSERVKHGGVKVLKQLLIEQLLQGQQVKHTSVMDEH
jgi:hypothetical protein